MEFLSLWSNKLHDCLIESSAFSDTVEERKVIGKKSNKHNPPLQVSQNPYDVKTQEHLDIHHPMDGQYL